MLKILIVCTGNICRSPAAQAILEDLIEKNHILKGKVMIDSCATHSYHIGSMPDYRVITVLAEKGIVAEHLKARQVQPDDCDKFDILLAMDQHHIELLQNIMPLASRDKIALFLDYAEGSKENVADPYFGDIEGFYQMYDVLFKASQKLISKLEDVIIQ